jgi:TM2 domain-containing membrane protein YozV
VNIHKKYYRRFLKKNLIIVIILALCSLGLLGLGIEKFYPALIPIGLGIIIYLLIGTTVFLIKYRKQKKLFNETIVFPQEFIDRYNKIEKVKYVYDSSVIKYFEEEIEKQTIEWKYLEKTNSDINSIYLDFNDVNKNIWIPRKMTIPTELTEFEEFINKIRTTANNGEHAGPL